MKVKTFIEREAYKLESKINNWLSNNKIEIKHTTQSAITEDWKTNYEKGIKHMIMISIFYEDSE